jgi:cysteinyl-tRNA synthetase
MDDDFNTGAAVGDLFELLRTLNRFMDQHGLDSAGPEKPAERKSLHRGALTLRELSALLGLFRAAPVQREASDTLVGGLMELLIALREESRKKKDFATADRIREGVGKLGITLEDRKDGTGWRR